MSPEKTVFEKQRRHRIAMPVVLLMFLSLLGFNTENTAPYSRTYNETGERVVTAVDDVYNVVEGTSITISAPGLLLNDSGATEAILDTAPVSGTLLLNLDGSFTYTHDGLSTTPDSFTYIAGDGSTSDTATVDINIVPINFGVSQLVGHSFTQPTSIQFGPDSMLYVLRKKGNINILKIQRNGPNDYSVVSEATTALVRGILNHDDDGTPNPGLKTRQATGILVTGTPSNPVMYVNSSDSRVGGSGGATDTDLDTNSGVLSRLTWIGTDRDDPAGYWEKVDIVRGLPRSEENHAPNGMALSLTGDTLFVTVGGFTNAGAPSNNFAFITEYAYAAAILTVDLPAINAMPTLTDTDGVAYKYDLPTLDDPTRPNANGIDDPLAAGYDGIDVNDPWGGNDGLNQAKWDPTGPVQVHATGFRNPYDVVVTRTPGREGRLYSSDNGPNGSWGGHPVGEGAYPGGTAGQCTNEYDPLEPGSSTAGPNDPKVNNLDNLHYIRELVPGEKYYAGHPTPIRGNPAGAGLYTGDYGSTGIWRDGSDPLNPLPPDWPPVPVSEAYPAECDYRNPGDADGSLAVFPVSVNGLTEYTASNFSGVFQGDLLGAGYNNTTVYHIDLNEAGDQVLNNEPDRSGTGIFASNFGTVLLDVIAQGDFDPFPGTVWVSDFLGHGVHILEPGDYDGAPPAVCTGANDPLLDEDGDGFDNADELLNGTNACSAADRPADRDGDLTSDLVDTDDDNDGIDDIHDPFQIDADNGMTTGLPLDYPLLNEDPGTGFFGLGFTGVMGNGVDDYLDLYDFNELIPGGTAGLFTVTNVPDGDAAGATNTQQNGFQVGVNVGTGTGPYTARVRMLDPFFDALTPQDDQAQGFYIGAGDQDNYVAIVLNAQAGTGGVRVVHEEGGVVLSSIDYPAADILNTVNLDLLLAVDPASGLVQPKYVRDGAAEVHVGLPILVSGDLLAVIQGSYQAQPGFDSGLAVGVISTSAGPGPAFNATWDHVEVTADPAPTFDKWITLQAPQEPRQRHENAFVEAGGKFYLMGGRGNRRTAEYDPVANTWTDLSLPPFPMHHFQAASLGGIVYVIGAYMGDFPSETPVAQIYSYDPATDTWTPGSTIPAARQRGAAGLVVYDGKLYLVGGSIGGHAASATYPPMFDEYDPATDTWTALPDAPRGRDHFNAAVVGDKLYAVGGRAGAVGATVAEVDVYDFAAGSWSTLPSPAGDVPTPRGGTTAAVVGSDIFFLGGESNTQTAAHSEVEALDTSTNSWRTLSPLNQGRHGTQAVVEGAKIYIAAGSGETGGGPELTSLEVFERTSLSDPSTVLPSTLASSPSSHDFGQVQVGSIASEVFTLSNTGGNQDISVSAISVSGSADLSVSFAETLPHMLTPGSTLEVTVDFTPTSVGSLAGNLQVTHDGVNNPLNVALTGDATSGVLTDEPIYRVNAGGGGIGATPLMWDRDTKNKPSPYINAATGDNKTHSLGPFAGVNDTGAPNVLFERERWDPAGNEEMLWTFPVDQPSLYDVRLFFYEADPNEHAVGARLFDVTIEAEKVLDNYDIFADVGALVAVEKSFPVYVDDGAINILLTHEVNNPIISGIEIRPVSGGVDMIASADSLDFFTVEVDSTSESQSLTLTNTTTGALDVTGVAITGAHAGEFSHTFSGPVTIPGGGDTSFDLEFTPLASGDRVANLEISHTGVNSPLAISLKGQGTNAHLSYLEILVTGSGAVSKSPDYPLYNDGEIVTLTATPDPGWQFDSWSGDAVGPDNPIDVTISSDMAVTALFVESSTVIDPIYRVNAGAGGVSDSPILWVRDTKNKPAPYVNADVGDNKVNRDAFTGVNVTDAPSAVFDANRWDPAGGLDMSWTFPVAIAGPYDVKLYFAETGSNDQNPGSRVFDVVIESNLVLDNYDIVADVGHQTAVMKTFNIDVLDGAIDITLLHEVDNPMISAIEIVPTPATVPPEMKFNGKNTFLVRTYEQVGSGAWELVGLPLDVTSEVYDNLDPKPELLVYDAGEYGKPDHVRKGHGYWMLSVEEQSNRYEGERVDTLAINLTAGWNLISGPSCDVELSAMSGSEHLVPKTLYRYENGYYRSSRLDQGRGYWVLAKEAGRLVLECGPTSPVLAPQVIEEPQGFGRLVVRDEGGAMQELRFGGALSETVDERMYTLPPLAPGRGFDARFGSDRWLIERTQGTISLKSNGQPIDVELTAVPEGSDETYVVTAMRGGVEVETRKMRAGDAMSLEADVDGLTVQSLSEWESNLPDRFALQGNYPNPFNPTTTIVFDLPERADVEIEVFDMLGRRVMVLARQVLEAGTQKRVEFDGNGLASGVYLYRVVATMESHTARDTGKMIMLK